MMFFIFIFKCFLDKNFSLSEFSQLNIKLHVSKIFDFDHKYGKFTYTIICDQLRVFCIFTLNFIGKIVIFIHEYIMSSHILISLNAGDTIITWVNVSGINELKL